MNIDELRQVIEQRTGVPASILTGDTAEDNITQAKALLAYKREAFSAQMTSKDRFASFVSSQLGIEDPLDRTSMALDEVAEDYRVSNGGYPRVADGGDPYINGKSLPDPRPLNEQFMEWIQKETTYDLSKDSEGWKHL